MFQRAEANAKRRLVYTEKPSQFQRKQALLGDMRETILQLSGGIAEDEALGRRVAEHLGAVDGGEGGDEGAGGLSSELMEAVLDATTSNGTRAAQGAENGTALASQAEVFRDAVKLGEEITRGAISLSGAISEEEADPTPSLTIVKVPWLAAVRYAEDNFTGGAGAGDDGGDAFDSWYERMGGRRTDVTRSAEVGQASALGVLVAEDDLRAGDAVLEMPLKCMLNQLSVRNRRLKGGFLGEKLKEAFRHSQEWGLALTLLYEQNQHLYGDGSKWGPFIETLGMRLLGTAAIAEIAGTFAAEMMKIEEGEMDDAYGWVSRHVCKTDSSGLCGRKGSKKMQSGVYTREDFRWALTVVRQNAVMVKLATTGKEYLSLVPLANLASHDPDAGGDIVLGLDNVARLHLGSDVAAFHPVKLTKGAFTDSETFHRYHAVSEQVNRFNSVRMKIPGGGAAGEDIIYRVQTLRDWRKAVGLPPRAADLWRAASQLNLYGEDEEEQKFMDRQNRIVSGTELEPLTREEELMLTGRAKNREEAALMVKPAGNAALMESEFSDSQLYSAPDLEEDVTLQMAAKNLKEAAHQLHISTAMNLTKEGSIGKVMNETRNFFLHGTAPSRGLDAIDELLIRKIEVMDKCGQPDHFVIRADNVSEELLCAMRVTLCNETELGLIEKNFNVSKGITRANEMLMLQSLHDSVLDLLRMHPVSVEEDEALLESDELSLKKRFAVTLRMREKRLLHSTLNFVKNQMKEVFDSTAGDDNDGGEDRSGEEGGSHGGKEEDFYQIAAILLEEREKERRLEDLQRKLEEETARLNTKAEVATATVNVRKAGEEGQVESANITIYEGDSLVDKVAEFAAKHDIDRSGRIQLENHVKNQIPEAPPIAAMVQTITRYGAIAVLGVSAGENVTDKVERLLLTQGILEESEEKFHELLGSLGEKLEARLSARFLLQIPVVAPDGRKLAVQVRDGEQHDMVGFMKTFAQYAKLPMESVGALAQEATRRLPQAILQVPVNLGGSKGVTMRIAAGDEDRLDELIAAFCKRHDIHEEHFQHQIKRTVLLKLNPGASLL